MCFSFFFVLFRDIIIFLELLLQRNQLMLPAQNFAVEAERPQDHSAVQVQPPPSDDRDRRRRSAG